MADGIEFRLRYVLDSQPFDRAVIASTSNATRFDSALSGVEKALLGTGNAAQKAGQAQAAAGSGGNVFLAALEKQLAALRGQSSAIGKTEADLIRLKAAEAGVAQQAEGTIQAIEAQARALQQSRAGQQAIDNVRNVAALDAERRAVEQGIAVDIRAGRAKADLIREIEREAAALARLNSVPRGTATGGVVDRVRQAAAADPEFAARAQVPLQNLGAAQATRDNAAFIASLERTSQAAGRTRAELLALEAAQRGLSAQAAPLIARIAQVDRGFQSFSKTGRLTALELQQVGFQLNDFFVQVAGGQGVLLPLIQQGSQLSGTFGGVGKAVAALRSLITPTVIALGGLAAGVGGFTGSHRMMLVPWPCSLSARTVPPCARTMCFTMESPSPVPPCSRLRPLSAR